MLTLLLLSTFTPRATLIISRVDEPNIREIWNYSEREEPRMIFRSVVPRKKDDDDRSHFALVCSERSGRIAFLDSLKSKLGWTTYIVVMDEFGRNVKWAPLMKYDSSRSIGIGWDSNDCPTAWQGLSGKILLMTPFCATKWRMSENEPGPLSETDLQSDLHAGGNSQWSMDFIGYFPGEHFANTPYLTSETRFGWSAVYSRETIYRLSQPKEEIDVQPGIRSWTDVRLMKYPTVVYTRGKGSSDQMESEYLDREVYVWDIVRGAPVLICSGAYAICLRDRGGHFDKYRKD